MTGSKAQLDAVCKNLQCAAITCLQGSRRYSSLNRSSVMMSGAFIQLTSTCQSKHCKQQPLMLSLQTLCMFCYVVLAWLSTKLYTPMGTRLTSLIIDEAVDGRIHSHYQKKMQSNVSQTNYTSCCAIHQKLICLNKVCISTSNDQKLDLALHKPDPLSKQQLF